MMETTRRTFLSGAALSTLPVAAVASAGDQPAKPFDLQEWLNTADPDAVVHYHAGQLAAAMNRVDASRSYRVSVDYAKGFALAVGDPTA